MSLFTMQLSRVRSLRLLITWWLCLFSTLVFSTAAGAWLLKPHFVV